MTALKSEFEEAKHEGVQFKWHRSPIRYIGTSRLEGLECEYMENTQEGSVRGTGQIEQLPANKVIIAIGQRPAARIISTTSGIEVNDQGYVITKVRPYGMTTRRGIFAGGDVVHEPATVVLAMI